MIELRGLGTAEIRTPSATLTPSQEIVFAAALYLILERGKPVSRSRLASLLWPGTAAAVRGHRLRQTMHQLRKLGFLMDANRYQVQMARGGSRSDTDSIPTKAAELTAMGHSLEFLPGYEPSLSEPFQDWLESRRAEVHGNITSFLVHEIDIARRRADWDRVETIATKCLSLDAYNETAILGQAEAMAMRGGKKNAVSLLDRYLADLGGLQSDLRLPATLLRKRIVERVPDRPAYRHFEPPFVGREQEMEILTHLFERARTGRGATIRLVGEPGIGKSRICAELARFAELQGAYVQRASCRRTYADRPLSVFVELVPLLRDLPGALGCNPETFATLRRLTEFEKPLGNLFSSQDSELLFENVKAALFDLVDSVAEEKTLVIIIDDVQWLDPASEKVLSRMIEWAEEKRLFFLINARESANPRSPLPIDTLSVGPLKPAASRVLLESMATPRSETVAAFVRWCLGVAEGNPFFLQELVHHWAETGERYEAPPSVAKILDERISRLSPDALQVLQVASVLGDHSSLERIETVLEFQSHRFLSAIEELSKAAMLRIQSEGVEAAVDRLQPRHDLLSSAALGRLAPVSLAFLHRRSADVIENEFDKLTMPIALLWACASHRDFAGDREKALKVSLACAEHLLDVGLAGDSATAFQKSLEYCGTDEQRLLVLPRVAFAAQLNGEWNRTKEVLNSCIRLAAKGDPAENSHNQFELMLFAARHQSELDFETLLSDLMICIDSRDATPAHRVKAAIFALKIATDIGPETTLDSIFEHVRPFLEDESVDEAARLELQIIYRTTRCKEVIPIETLERFSQLARRSGGELAYSRALLTSSSACRLSARYEDSLRFLAKAYEHATSNKWSSVLSRLHLFEIRLHLAAEQYERAQITLQRLMNCVVQPDDVFMRSDLEACRVRLALHRGDQLTATAAFAEMAPISEGLSPRRRAYSLALLMRIQLLHGASQTELRATVTQLHKDSERVRSMGGYDYEAYALYLGMRAIGESARAFTLLNEYVDTYRRSYWKLPEIIISALREARATPTPQLSVVAGIAALRESADGA